MMHKLAAVPALLVLVLAALVSGALGLAPEPDPVPRRWQFDVKFGDLKVTSVAGKQYLYLTYKVTNSTGNDLLFAPSFEMTGTDDVAVRRSGRNVPASVTATILQRLNNPLLEDQIAIIGKLQRGPENARQGLVVWPVESARPGAITVFAAGFSGETAIVVPRGKTEADKVTLRKTYMQQFGDLGDIGLMSDGAFPLVEGRWVMR